MEHGVVRLESQDTGVPNVDTVSNAAADGTHDSSYGIGFT